jgi:hypothetical protein
MDDIIVIILTLIFIVASIFGQKKKRQPVSETAQQPKGDNFWDMPDEQWNDAQHPDAPPPQKPVEKQEQTNEKSQPHLFEPEKEGIRTVLKEPEKTKKTIQKVKKKKFPLKEAVIYSEILNRKYT